MIKYIFAYRHAFAIGLATTVALLGMQQIASWWGVLASVVLWVALIWFVLHRLKTKIEGHWGFFLLLCVSAAGFGGLTSLVSSGALRLFLDIAAGATIGLILVDVIQTAYELPRSRKQWRRITMMIWVFSVYAWITSLYAFVLFFPTTPLIFFTLWAGLIAGLAAERVWAMYVPEQEIRFAWALLVGYLMIVMFGVAAYTLPFGYLALGVITVWVWYLLQLLIRFHLSPRGILWRQQRPFLLINALVFGILVFRMIRWI